jgi:hypothetical protein
VFLGRLRAEQPDVPAQRAHRISQGIPAQDHDLCRGCGRRIVRGGQAQHHPLKWPGSAIVLQAQPKGDRAQDLRAMAVQLGIRDPTVTIVVDARKRAHWQRHDHEGSGVDDVERAALRNHQVRLSGRRCGHQIQGGAQTNECRAHGL